MESQLLQVSSVIDKERNFNKQIIWQTKHSLHSHNQQIIDKIIQLDRGGSAILLKNDTQKPLRFIYLCLLMSKKNSYNLLTLISKMNLICSNTQQIIFLGIQSESQKLFGKNPQIIYQNLLELNKRMELQKFSQTYILQLILQNKFIDLLMILLIRVIADQYKIINALDCQQTLTLGQVQLLLNKFFVDKGAITNQRNKYVIFWPFDQYQIKFFKEKGITIQTQSENYQQISDPYPVKYQNCIMIQKVFSLLDQQCN